ncbi:MAG TPA: NAD(P)H-binding protein [Solidesulfovibrio sp.]|nr:NAD(P)H-binding protein [Solidesulfovibrio sp.]
MHDRILVLGATGLVGGQVFQALSRHGYDVRGASRRKSGGQWAHFDLLDPATHAPALDGVDAVMLVSRPGDEEAHVHAAPFLEAMAAAGVRRVVDISALGAQLRPDFSIRRVERLVEDSGLEWTHVRPNFFAQMLARPPLSTEIARSRTLRLPLDAARVAYVDAHDVAAVAFRALTDRGLAGRAISLNGPEALDHGEIARRISKALGETVRYIAISEAQARELLVARGFPAPQVERVLRFYALCRQGVCAAPDTEAAQLLGRPLGTLEAVITANLPVWQAGAHA